MSLTNEERNDWWEPNSVSTHDSANVRGRLGAVQESTLTSISSEGTYGYGKR